jgi:hypothetical protein|nr:MAG TPA: hypothetical protein [Caudoviricetes sp.]
MKENKCPTFNDGAKKEIAMLLDKVFGKDIDGRMSEFQLLFDELRVMKMTNNAYLAGSEPYNNEQIEVVAAQAVGTLYHILTLCGLDLAGLLANYIERVKDGTYTLQSAPKEKMLNFQSYELEYVQNGVIFNNNIAREVNVFEFEDGISKALSIRSVREKLGALIMSDIEYIVNEDDGNKYKVEVVIKKEDC